MNSEAMMFSNSQKWVQSISAREGKGETSTPKLFSENELRDF